MVNNKGTNQHKKLYSEAYLKRVLPRLLKLTGGVSTKTAELLNINSSSFHRLRAKYPWIDEMRQEARDSIVDKAETKLFEHLENGEEWAIKHVLRYLGASRGWSETQIMQLQVNNINNANFVFEPPEELNIIEHEPSKDKTDT